MAALSTFCVLLALLLFSMLPEIFATTVEVTVPVHPVTSGGILAIQCQILNMEEDYIVKMFHVTKTSSQEMTTGMSYVASSFGQRIFLVRRNVPGGITVFFTTIVDVSILDQGEYLCRVYTLSGRDYVKVAEDAADVEIYFLPDSIYPQCQSEPVITENMQEDVQLKLTCISAKGAPAVSLRWIDNSNQEMFSRTKSQGDTFFSEFNLRTSTSIHNTIFICEMTSAGFTDFKRTCKIGPITIRTNTHSQDTTIMTPNLSVQPTQLTKHKTLILNGCKSECPFDDKYTIYILV